jgi:opacity protein-like surface antigen
MEDVMKRTVLILLLALGVLPAGQALAQSNVGLHGIGASLAFVSPEDLDGTVGLGVFADLGFVTPQIGLEPHIEYWSTSEQAYGAEVSMRDVAIGCRGKYYFEVANTKMRPFAGAGLGLHFLKAEASVTVPGFPTMSDEASDTQFGIDLGGGLATPLGPKDDLHFELWYGVVSDVSQLALRVGISHKLGL